MSHAHHHAVPNYYRAFAIGVALNVAFVAVEALFGVLSGSLALIADAGHNLSDVLGLLLAWGAAVLAGRRATARRTYGYRKATVIASLASALLLLVTLGGIAWEAVERLFNPQPVAGATVIAVAAVGMVINAATALLFMSGSRHDLNIRGAFLHMAADAAVSLGVVVAGAVILATGWLLMDPLISIAIALVIFVGTWSLLRDSMNLAMDAVPNRIDIGAIRRFLEDLDEVSRIHDLHVWPISTTEVALSVHLVLRDEAPRRNFLHDAQLNLYKRFHIGHATIQLERPGELPCLLDDQGCA